MREAEVPVGPSQGRRLIPISREPGLCCLEVVLLDNCINRWNHGLKSSKTWDWDHGNLRHWFSRGGHSCFLKASTGKSVTPSQSLQIFEEWILEQWQCREASCACSSHHVLGSDISTEWHGYNGWGHMVTCIHLYSHSRLKMKRNLFKISERADKIFSIMIQWLQTKKTSLPSLVNNLYLT